MPWTLRDAKREKAIVENIDKGDDRSAAILAGAFLEDRLTSTIKSYFTPDAQVQGNFFKGYGPLATFSAKIDMAYLLGIIDKQTRDAFHIIREIRNRFAHRLDIDSFSEPPIKGLCVKLFNQNSFLKILDQTKKENLGSMSEGLMFLIDNMIEPIARTLDSPRNSYMNCIKLHLLTMEMQGFVNDRQDAAGGLVLVPSTPSPEKSDSPPQRPPQTDNRAPRKRVCRPRSSPV